MKEIETKSFTILSPADVAEFFFWLVFKCQVNIHPDDNFTDYVDIETSKPTFNDKQCDMYNEIMDDCFTECERVGCDIYAIADRILRLYHYCYGNHELA